MSTAYIISGMLKGRWGGRHGGAQGDGSSRLNLLCALIDCWLAISRTKRDPFSPSPASAHQGKAGLVWQSREGLLLGRGHSCRQWVIWVLVPQGGRHLCFRPSRACAQAGAASGRQPGEHSSQLFSRYLWVFFKSVSHTLIPFSGFSFLVFDCLKA